MVNYPYKYHLDTSPHASYIVIQSQIFYHKIVSVDVFFNPGPWFLKIDFCVDVCMFVCLCMCVYPPPRLLITSGVMWRDMGPI